MSVAPGAAIFLATNDRRTGAAMSAKVIRDVCMMTALVIALVALRAMLS
jgi:hypothetical protein